MTQETRDKIEFLIWTAVFQSWLLYCMWGICKIFGYNIWE